MQKITKIQKLLNEKASLQSLINISKFNGSIEIKTINNEKYIYLRKMQASRHTSTYIDKFSDELYSLAINESLQIRTYKKKIRQIEKELALLGYEEKEISSRVRLNIDFARANIKNLIYNQAVLEGVSTTFPQTETILENGIINGVSSNDVQKILNLKHAWEFIVDPDVISSKCNYYLLSHIAKLVNEGFYDNGGSIRSVPVSIGGSTYIPPYPNEIDIKENIDTIINSKNPPIDNAIELVLFCMKKQIFIDGNKRAAVIFANHYMIQSGLGLFIINENNVPEFKELLIKYYEDKDTESIKTFLKEKCWLKF